MPASALEAGHGQATGHVQAEDGGVAGLRVEVVDELTQAGFEPDLLDALRAQAHECRPQRFHHLLLRPGDGLRIPDDFGAIGGCVGLDDGG